MVLGRTEVVSLQSFICEAEGLVLGNIVHMIAFIRWIQIRGMTVVLLAGGGAIILELLSNYHLRSKYAVISLEI